MQLNLYACLEAYPSAPKVPAKTTAAEFRAAKSAYTSNVK